MATHDLKISPENFERVIDGGKTFEIRYGDRNFRSGDGVILREYVSKDKKYTGRKCCGIIGNISTFEQKDGYVVFSLLNVTDTVGIRFKGVLKELTGADFNDEETAILTAIAKGMKWDAPFFDFAKALADISLKDIERWDIGKF